MYYNTLFVGMDVHKETFSLCCYDLQQDRIFHAQKMEADYKKVLNYLNAVRKAIGKDGSSYAAMRPGASDSRCITN